MTDTATSTFDFRPATAAFERMLVRLRAVDHFAIGRRVLTLVALARYNTVMAMVLRGVAGSGSDTARHLVIRQILEQPIDAPAAVKEAFQSVLIPDVMQSRWEQGVDYAAAILTELPLSVPDRHFGEWFSERLDQIVSAGPLAPEVSTPLYLAEFMVQLASIKPGQYVFDPCCGQGGLLAEAWKREPSAALRGSDIHPISAALAQLRFALLQVPAIIQREDSLLELQLEQFDRVLCDPPLGFYGEFAGQRSADTKRLETLFLERSVDALAPGGRAVVLVTQAVLARRGAEQILRNRILEAGLLEAVIALPASAVPRASVDMAILILSRNEANTAVRMFDGGLVASTRAVRGGHVFAAIRSIFEAGDSDGCRSVDYANLREADGWIPRRYIAPPVKGRDPSLLRTEAHAYLERAAERLPRILALFDEVLPKDT
ncbi:MAG: N-6 DNA methylase [Bordetella sp.]|nr:N-6 DNA methylase [Bordetella sp.]